VDVHIGRHTGAVAKSISAENDLHLSVQHRPPMPRSPHFMPVYGAISTIAPHYLPVATDSATAPTGLAKCTSIGLGRPSLPGSAWVSRMGRRRQPEPGHPG
jgi:hypothetical protein